MTESEKAEQDVAAARVIERVAKWKAMEAKASYYHYASKAMEASAEVMGARIRRDKMIAAEFADKAFANSTAQAPTTVSDSGEGGSEHLVSVTLTGTQALTADELERAGDEQAAQIVHRLSALERGGEVEQDASEFVERYNGLVASTADDVTHHLGGFEAKADEPPQEAPAIPEGFIPWSGGECPVPAGTIVRVKFRADWAGDPEIYGPGQAEYIIADDGDTINKISWQHSHGQSQSWGDIIAYRILTPQTQPETSALDKVEDAPPGGGANVFLEQAEAAILDKSEDELATPQQLEAAGIIEPGASEMAAMRLAPAPKKFGGIFSFGAKKTMAEEGV